MFQVLLSITILYIKTCDVNVVVDKLDHSKWCLNIIRDDFITLFTIELPFSLWIYDWSMQNI